MQSAKCKVQSAKCIFHFPPPILILISLVFFLSGCGYTSRSFIKTEAKDIYVETFQNKIDITEEVSERHKYKIYRPFLEVQLTNAVIDRFIYDGSLKVVDEERASLVLEGELVEYLRQPLKYSDAETVEEYRLSLVVNLALKDVKNGKTLLTEKGLTGDTTYFTAGSLAKSEEDAQQALFEDMARRIVNRVVYQW